MNKEAIIEGVKQMLRVVLFSALPVIVTSLNAGETNWKAISLSAFIAILAGIDKYIHEEPRTDLNGISPF